MAVFEMCKWMSETLGKAVDKTGKNMISHRTVLTSYLVRARSAQDRLGAFAGQSSWNLALTSP